MHFIVSQRKPDCGGSQIIVWHQERSLEEGGPQPALSGVPGDPSLSRLGAHPSSACWLAAEWLLPSWSPLCIAGKNKEKEREELRQLSLYPFINKAKDVSLCLIDQTSIRWLLRLPQEVWEAREQNQSQGTDQS